jgi:hypothetical protein
MKFNIFLSYDSKNKQPVNELYSILVAEGLTVWIDTKNMIKGKIEESRREGLLNSNLFVCCLTENYVKRDNCMREFRFAEQNKNRILYFLFNKTSDLSVFQPIDFYMANEIRYSLAKMDRFKEAVFEFLKDMVCFQWSNFTIYF